MKKTIQLIVVLFLTILCESALDSCFSHPRQFNFDFELDVDQLKFRSCTYFDVKESKILDYEYEEPPHTGIFQIKI
jgi:hypothetical protein